ncbi:TSUP family transporter [Leucobacter sp. PH1c]|uniref:TSUP family transporter n=1 Tax=Leucobacter sp. PH1c TaxID=1397278 RepID=UPI00055FD76A|nr:TSUP family transporter [Leucobacter sp. PH1c]
MDTPTLTALLVLVAIGALSGVTTVLFGFGGGFVAVPVIAWADARLGAAALTVAVATSAAVMVVNAGVATAATPRRVLRTLRGSGLLLALLGLGGALGAWAGLGAPAPLIRWGFVAYLLATILDLLLRPGFFRPATASAAAGAAAPIPDVSAGPRVPAWLGLPIGALAAFLGVGGSVMTVPVLRRAGAPMSTATTLANPLTLALSAPALAAFLMLGGTAAAGPGGGAASGSALSAQPSMLGAVDAASAAALLAGAIPVIVWLRRRPVRLPDRVHAWAYLALLLVTALAMALSPA